MKKTKILKNYLIQLPIVGALGFIGGLILTYVLLKSDDYWSINYIPFKLLGAYLAYTVSNRGAPGGGVNYHASEETKNKDEKKLDKLIIKYKTKQFVAITTILYITLYIILNIINFNKSSNFNLGDAFFLLIINFFTLVALCEGVKYISAWWNIQKNIKKEF